MPAPAQPLKAPEFDGDPLSGADVEQVWRDLRGQVRPTTILRADRLDQALGVRVVLVSETFQHTGSFKFRAALAVALGSGAPRLLTASSGNFGAALALSAARTGKGCTVVMPQQSAAVKIAAVRALGATVDLIDTARVTRGARVQALSATDPAAEVVSAYDDHRVIAGNSSLGAELFAWAAAQGPIDAVLVPVGGGGLSSGLVVARDRLSPGVPVLGAEPLLGNDAARSLQQGVLCTNDREPDTICDGARTLSLGRRNFAVLRKGLGGIVEVSEEHVAAAVRLLFEAANLKAEPTGALSVAALLQDPGRFAGRTVACVVSGGNVDAAVYAGLIAPRGSLPPAG